MPCDRINWKVESVIASMIVIRIKCRKFCVDQMVASTKTQELNSVIFFSLVMRSVVALCDLIPGINKSCPLLLRNILVITVKFYIPTDMIVSSFCKSAQPLLVCHHTRKSFDQDLCR